MRTQSNHYDIQPKDLCILCLMVVILLLGLYITAPKDLGQKVGIVQTK